MDFEETAIYSVKRAILSVGVASGSNGNISSGYSQVGGVVLFLIFD